MISAGVRPNFGAVTGGDAAAEHAGRRPGRPRELPLAPAAPGLPPPARGDVPAPLRGSDAADAGQGEPLV